MWVWVSGGVYKNWCLNALEGSFALNLTILGVTTYHIIISGGNQLAVGYASIALVTFIRIFVYQLGNVTGITQYTRRKNSKQKSMSSRSKVEPPGIGSLPDCLINPGEYQQPFYTLHPTEKVTENRGG